MAIKGLNKVIKNLGNVKKALANDVDPLFIRKSLEWISFQANTNLDNRTSHFWGSDARSWNYKIYQTFGILENQDMNSASIEFGIGRVGANNPQRVAIEQNYQYDKPSQYKDDNGNWTFQDARTGIWVRFNGYEGKSFLYDAFMDYMQGRIWVQLYQQAFDEVMRSVIV